MKELRLKAKKIEINGWIFYLTETAKLAKIRTIEPLTNGNSWDGGDYYFYHYVLSYDGKSIELVNTSSDFSYCSMCKNFERANNWLVLYDNENNDSLGFSFCEQSLSDIEEFFNVVVPED